MCRSSGSRRLRSCWGFFLLGLLVAGNAGCSRTTGEVSGTVKYKGKPLPGGMVSFVCPQGTFSSQITPDGKYTISQVPIGPAKVAVFPPMQSRTQVFMWEMWQKMSKSKKVDESKLDPEIRKMLASLDKAAAPVEEIPSHYQNPEKSGLELTVVAGRQVYDIELK